MKKVFSSAFTVLLLLNVMGYYGVLLGVKFRHDLSITRQIDAGDYDASAVLSLKIPFKASGAEHSENYDRVNGEFERDGAVYKMIKQRLYRDTFHILYIEDQRAAAIKKAIEDYVRTFSDKASDDSPQGNPVPSFIKEYLQRAFVIENISTGWERALATDPHVISRFDDFFPSIIHPPERA